jgi:DNA-binding transcriptional LysR family regulator
MTFDPSTLSLFLDVTRMKSFSRAAGEHGITQSAASQRIAQLEKRLGVTLIDRSVRPWLLTPAGQKLALGVEDLVQRWRALEKVVCTGIGSSVPASPVRVAAIYSAGIDLLSRVGELYESAHPGGLPVIRYDTPSAIRDALAEGSADVGIVSYPSGLWAVGRKGPAVAEGDLISHVMWEEPMAVICPAGHPLTREQSVHARHLGPHEMLAFDHDLPVGRAVAEYLASHKVSPRITHRFDNLDTLKSAVVETGRCAILPRRTVRREVEAGDLMTVRLLPLLCRPMGVLINPRLIGEQRAGVDALLQTLQEELIRRFDEAAKRSSDPASVGYKRPDDAGPDEHPRRLASAERPSARRSKHSPALTGDAA